jgi:hypothetical protein
MKKFIAILMQLTTLATAQVPYYIQGTSGGKTGLVSMLDISGSSVTTATFTNIGGVRTLRLVLTGSGGGGVSSNDCVLIVNALAYPLTSNPSNYVRAAQLGSAAYADLSAFAPSTVTNVDLSGYVGLAGFIGATNTIAGRIVTIEGKTNTWNGITNTITVNGVAGSLSSNLNFNVAGEGSLTNGYVNAQLNGLSVSGLFAFVNSSFPGMHGGRYSTSVAATSACLTVAQFCAGVVNRTNITDYVPGFGQCIALSLPDGDYYGGQRWHNPHWTSSWSAKLSSYGYDNWVTEFASWQNDNNDYTGPTVMMALDIGNTQATIYASLLVTNNGLGSIRFDGTLYGSGSGLTNLPCSSQIEAVSNLTVSATIIATNAQLSANEKASTNGTYLLMSVGAATTAATATTASTATFATTAGTASNMIGGVLWDYNAVTAQTAVASLSVPILNTNALSWSAWGFLTNSSPGATTYAFGFGSDTTTLNYRNYSASTSYGWSWVCTNGGALFFRFKFYKDTNVGVVRIGYGDGGAWSVTGDGNATYQAGQAGTWQFIRWYLGGFTNFTSFTVWCPQGSNAIASGASWIAIKGERP